MTGLSDRSESRGKYPLRLIAHAHDIEHGDVVAGERHVANGGKTRRLPAVVGLCQPLQPELEIGQPPFGLGACEMPVARPFGNNGWGFRLCRASGSLQHGVRVSLQNGLLTSR